MKISTPNASAENLNLAITALQEFLSQAAPKEAPPCPGCQDHTPEKCKPGCSDAPRAMSIDPELYPIEPGVVPLVYELFSMRLVQPCWSCEGHTQELTDGEQFLWKIPQVCFYSSSPVYPQLLLRCLNDLKFTKQLEYVWHVVLSDFSQTWEVTYSLQPDLNQVDKADIKLIQKDLLTISNNLYSNMRIQASKMLAELQQQLKAAS